MRPEECFRLRREHVRDGSLHVLAGKTINARRVIALSPRSLVVIEEARVGNRSPWVFPAPTESGHVEKSSLRKMHRHALKVSKVQPFVLYTFRHTCLTRWATSMDPYTLAYLAGHSDFSVTKRYVHPQKDTVLDAMEKARNKHRKTN